MQPWEVENIRRSVAMLQPGAPSFLRREEALQLLEEVRRLHGRLEQLRDELLRLADSADS